MDSMECTVLSLVMIGAVADQPCRLRSDIDFEYPSGTAQGRGLANLLTELRSAFNALAKRNGDSVPYQLTVTFLVHHDRSPPNQCFHPQRRQSLLVPRSMLASLSIS